MSVHRIVATAFIGPPPSLTHHINHINGVKNDNRVENLEWCTRSENQVHAIRNGMQGRVVMTPPKVRVVLRGLELGLTTRYLGSVFGVGRQAIGDIKTGRQWSHARGDSLCALVSADKAVVA